MEKYLISLVIFPRDHSFGMGIWLSTRASRLLHKCHENVTVYVLKLVVAAGPSPAGGQWCPAPHLKFVLPLSCLAHWLLHASNIVFKNVAPSCSFWPPPAAKSWRRARVADCCLVSISVATGVSLVNIRLFPSATSDNIKFLRYSFI